MAGWSGAGSCVWRAVNVSTTCSSPAARSVVTLSMAAAVVSEDAPRADWLSALALSSASVTELVSGFERGGKKVGERRKKC